MRLLITTQAVDLDDPVLGFMHRWIEEFAKRYESVEVICLKQGRMHLPSNVHVHSLGKSAQGGPASGRGSTVSRIRYILNFYRYLSTLRASYDAVFVHMNQEYVLLGGVFWRMSGKKVVLWRNHKKGSWTTQLAGLIAHVICYTSSAAYVAHFKNAVQMPIGIDTDTFAPSASPPLANSILFLGRIDKVKKPIEFLDALKVLADQHVDFHADIYGDPTYPNDPYFKKFNEVAKPLVENGRLTLFPSIANEKTPAIYGTHQVYVNLTPSGSFDKTIGEAMACGCIVVAANDAVREIIPGSCFVNDSGATSAVRAIEAVLSIDDQARNDLAEKSRDYIVRTHSLSLLIERLAPVLIGK